MTEAKNKENETNENNESGEKKADSGKKTLSLGGTLSLKGGGSSGARPSTSPTRGGPAVEVRRSKRASTQAKTTDTAGSPAGSGDDLANLTSAERQARIEALQKAMEGGGEKKTLPKRQTPTIKKREEKAEEAPSEDDLRKKELEELQRIQEQEKALAKAQKAEAEGVRRERSFGPDAATGETESYRDKLKKAESKAPPKPRGNEDRRRSRITVTQAVNNDFERDRGPSLAAQRRAREKARMAAKGEPMEKKKIIREVTLPEAITVQELANRMAEPGGEVVKILMKLGVMATINQTIDADTAELVIDEFGHKVKRVTEADIEVGIEGEEDSEKDLKPRPPVVTIMGHVDHGKTSLLDAMRKTDVVAGEAGGITQHIGAYQVNTSDGIEGNTITFLDTPGHAAFTEMRARGANVTDICIIVVAADDSIMPQTIEAINHAKAANVPIIIAINKIDLPAADPMKVKTELLQYDVVVEDMSGDVQCVEISAKNKQNLDKLEEAILLQAEILELKANPDRPAHGFVVESKLERGRGAVATALIQRGTLRIGDVFVAGAEMGKVKALINDRGQNVEEAIPGMPVEVLGLNAAPEAGDEIIVVGDERRASEISEYRQRKRREMQAAHNVQNRTTMDDLLLQREMGESTKLPVLIKADVHGSVEAIAGSLQKMADENEGVEVQVLHTGVGGITESDVTLAKASGALIIGFNVRAGAQARDMATRDGVDIRYYNVIYNVIDDAKAILSGMLSPTVREEYIGQAKVQQVFNITKVGKIAGCIVEMGAVRRGNKVRLLRDNVVIHEGMLKTLKRFKDEVKEVKEGTECGMAFESYDDLKEGDIIECYEIIEEERNVE
ncbi:MAG: translation initiation factor IF-2 [Alphaproteobacteria bacterium]